MKSEKVRNIISKATINNDNNNKIEIIECKKWKIDKNIINEAIPFWCISGIKNIEIDEIINQLTYLSISSNVRKELAELSKKILSIRPNKKK